MQATPTVTETPIFAEALKKDESRAKVPALAVFRDHFLTLVLGTMISIIAYALFYLMSVFSLSWGARQPAYTRNEFGDAVVRDPLLRGDDYVAGILAESVRRRAMIWMTIAAFVYGFVMPPLFASGTAGTVVMLCLGFG